MLDFFGTIGPACSSVETLVALINEGMTGVRINNSHSRLVDCEKYLYAIKGAESQTNIKQKILIDLQGAELRIGNLAPFLLKANDIVQIVCETANAVNQIPIPKTLYDALREKPAQLLLDDGLIKLNPLKIFSDYLEYQVESDCVIRPNKSIASDLEVKLPVLSDADIKDIEYAVELGSIYGIMIPFVRNASDLLNVKGILKDKNATQLKIYAKIENQSGVDNINEIIPHCDCVVIARGDLGANIPLIQIPKAQKHIAKICNESNREFMVVTQMLHSMISQPTPTRAEVLDIFNAVLDGATALMLTGETAMGKYPVESMGYLVKTALQSTY